MGSATFPHRAELSVIPSPNFGERRGGLRPQLIVIHYTAMASCAEAHQRLCDPAAEVSAHWLISETGEVHALVDESLRAWHAGSGQWAGIADVNSQSIGIELANFGNHPFAEPQMAALEILLAGVMARWVIAPRGVIAHSDMAPTRKSDPGARFDWRRLALAGLAVWPQVRLAEPPACLPALRAFGYPDAPMGDVLTAFRLRFRPWATGPVDQVDAGLAVDLAQRFAA